MGIVRDGNCPPGGNCPGWELSGMGIVRDGNCPPGGNCPGWELSGMGIVRDGNCPPGGNCPGWELSGMGIVRIPKKNMNSISCVTSSKFSTLVFFICGFSSFVGFLHLWVFFICGFLHLCFLHLCFFFICGFSSFVVVTKVAKHTVTDIKYFAQFVECTQQKR